MRLSLDDGHRANPNFPALRLFADVIQDAVDLVQGARHANATAPSKPADVAAARHWIEAGDVGVLTFNEACGWLGLDAEHARQAIFYPRSSRKGRLGVIDSVLPARFESVRRAVRGV